MGSEMLWTAAAAATEEAAAEEAALAAAEAEATAEGRLRSSMSTGANETDRLCGFILLRADCAVTFDR